MGADAHTTGSVSSEHNQEPRRSILIIERNPKSLKEISERCAEAGYDVRIVGDGLLAMNELRRSLPDAVIANVESPRISGIELAEELRDWGLPVILTSESDDPPVPSGVGVLHQPYETDELIQIIEQTMAAAGPAHRVISS